ncbi:hypothetical protein MTO96_049862 [Rhipicephalus appendiculatus]
MQWRVDLIMNNVSGGNGNCRTRSGDEQHQRSDEEARRGGDKKKCASPRVELSPSGPPTPPLGAFYWLRGRSRGPPRSQIKLFLPGATRAPGPPSSDPEPRGFS